MQKRSVEERFDEKYEVAETGCWLWTANQSKGYGLFWLRGKVRAAHRVAYERHVGQIPEGLQLDHLCRTPLCVNPTHLEPVSHRENQLRGIGFVSQNARVTHCPHGHPYDETNTYITYTGSRRCRACNKVRMHAYHQARKADLSTSRPSGGFPHSGFSDIQQGSS